MRVHERTMIRDDCGTRYCPRARVSFEVTLASPHNFYLGFSENVSAGGVFVATHLVEDIGAHIAMTLRLPDQATTIDVLGEVRWLKVPADIEDDQPGMGIRFLDLSPDDREQIEQFVREREPIFFDEA